MFLLFSIIAFLFIGLTIEERDKKDGCSTTFNFGWPTFWLAAWAVSSYFFVRSEFLGLFTSFNLLNFVMWMGVYILIGLAWSFFKWLRFSRLRAKEWRVAKSTSNHEVNSNGYNALKQQFMPLASRFIAEISAWIALWPFSIVSYIVGDFWDNIVTWFEKVYENITLSQFK